MVIYDRNRYETKSHLATDDLCKIISSFESKPYSTRSLLHHALTVFACRTLWRHTSGIWDFPKLAATQALSLANSVTVHGTNIFWVSLSSQTIGMNLGASTCWAAVTAAMLDAGLWFASWGGRVRILLGASSGSHIDRNGITPDSVPLCSAKQAICQRWKSWRLIWLEWTDRSGYTARQ